MMDVLGTSLTSEDAEIINHPFIGGLILFTRNFDSIAQVSQLVADMRKATNKDLLIAVDHEGGRVQRFREGFTQIPSMGSFIEKAHDLADAKRLAQICGSVMAMEVQAIGVDISFAPVLDVNGISEVIGHRSFHAEPSLIAPLASAFIEGMHSVGMKATGKHFPGHGSVQADSHIDLPIDNRPLSEIELCDLIPFKSLIASNKLDAIMPAHVIYPEVDAKSVGFSSLWLQKILRHELKYDGVIFSDDLSMEAASSIGGYVERSEAAQEAGCDMLLLCNHRKALEDVLDNANLSVNPSSINRIRSMMNTKTSSWKSMTENISWQKNTHIIKQTYSE